MKILKVLLLVAGVIGLAIGGYYLFQAWLEVRNIWAIANSMRNTTSVNPQPFVVTAALVGALGGLLLGIGIGLPLHTRGSVRRQALQDASDVRETAIRERIGGLEEQRGVTDGEERA